MKVLKLILYKYKRLSLNQIEKLTYIPKNNIQFIIGKNASGKSSLLRQLSPLPPDLKKDFLENGYKYIEIEHNNNKYILSSGYIPNKHSFKVNDQELNPGGTKRVQQDLVLQHFKITEDIMSVLYNDNRLTNMGPSERKKWFSLLSTVDYTYSLSVYNKLKTRYRDIIGGIKLLQNQILQDEANLLKEDKINKYIKDKEYISKFIDHLISLYDHNTTPNVIEDDVLNKLCDNISKLNNELIPNYTMDKLIEEKNKYNIKEKEIESKISSIVKQIDKAEKDMFLEDIEKIKELENKLSILKPKLVIDLDINSLNSVISTYTDIIPGFISKLLELDQYTDFKSISKNDLVVMKNNLDGISRGKNSLETRIKYIEQDITKLKQDVDTTCPKCGDGACQSGNQLRLPAAGAF